MNTFVKRFVYASRYSPCQWSFGAWGEVVQNGWFYYPTDRDGGGGEISNAVLTEGTEVHLYKVFWNVR